MAVVVGMVGVGVVGLTMMDVIVNMAGR